MQKELEILKESMESVFEVNEEIAKKNEEFKAENKSLFERQAELREKIDVTKDSIRVIAEAGFIADNQKKRLGGIGIQIRKLFEYEESQALDWAKTSGLCLKLDKKAFDKFATTGHIEFVEIKEKITVTFPKEIILGDPEDK